MKALNIGLIIIVFFYGCKTNIISNNYFDKICSGTLGFKVDSSRLSLSRYTIENNKYLDLRSLSIPSDTFFFRIESSKDTTIQIFEYSFYNSQSFFKIYRFPLGEHGRKILFDKEHESIRSYETIYNYSKKGNDFITQLEENEILDLPESYDIKGYPRKEYPTSFLIEYSNKCRYNILLFDNPSENSKNFKKAKQLSNFLEYLKNEFNFLK